MEQFLLDANPFGKATMMKQTPNVTCVSHVDTKVDENAPLYMCIKVGKMFSLVQGPSSDTLVRVRLKPEYWFTLPPDR